MNLRTAFTQVLVACLVSPVAVHGQRPQRAFRASVRFLATSTSVRSSMGESQDVYLVEVRFLNGSDEPSISRLIDEYPPYRAAISLQILRSETATTIRVRRDHGCDLRLGNMPLRTAPGDPSAILPEPLGFEPSLPRPVEKSAILPCYRIERH